MTSRQSEYLQDTIKHLDPVSFNSVPLIEGMQHMAFQARNLSRASIIFDQMIKEKGGRVFLCLAGSLISAGLKKTILTLAQNNMIDGIVSTGANMVDMDFFEGLGFKHYIGTPFVNDDELRKRSIDRIYDTFISEHDLRVCDASVAQVADRLQKRPHSSREITAALGAYLIEQDIGKDSLLRTCYEKNIPIFVPSLSDCSAGFGLGLHQKLHPDAHVSHDSVKDFTELTELVSDAEGGTGLLIIGGGVPKNFTQDTVVMAEILGREVPMHKFAVQITVADERDGALSGSTLKEAHSWGKVEEGAEQMVFSEATIALPLLVSYAYHKGSWQNRTARELSNHFSKILLSEDRVTASTKDLQEAQRQREVSQVA